MISTLNWLVIVVILLASLAIGLSFSFTSSRSGLKGYFTADRKLPWWAIGFSNSATYQSGAAGFVMLILSFGLVGNWLWWASWVIWMPLVAIVWAPIWRRLQVNTTAEVLSIRYSGKKALWTRKIYAFYSCFGFAVILISYITGFFVKTIAPVFEVSEFMVLLVLGGITVIYTMLGGLKGVVYADVFQFIVFLIGSFLFMSYALDEAGGIDVVRDKIMKLRPEALKLSPPTDTFPLILMIILIIQGFFFAGSPTAGEGSTAQRFMAAKSEKHAMTGQLLNAFLALSLRAIPLIGLGMICITLYSTSSTPTAAALTHIEDPVHAWGTLLVNTNLPNGMLGLLLATEVVAYVSTMSTLINWGSSFVVNDLIPAKWMQNSKQEAKFSRLTTLLLFIFSGIIATLFVSDMISWFVFINSAMVIFILPLSWLRFFWWRFNAYGELAAIILSIPMAVLVWFVWDFQSSMWQGLAILLSLSFITLFLITWLTPPEPIDKLREFYQRCHPPGWWSPVIAKNQKVERLFSSTLILNSILGIIACTGLVVATNAYFGGVEWLMWLGIVVTFSASILLVKSL